MLEATLSQALYGVSYGLLLFMLAAGLTLIFSMMGVLNFAHASFYMLGAYFAYQISVWLGFWVALFAAPLALFALGMAVERFGLRRVHKWGHVPYHVPQALDGPVGWLQAHGITFPQYRMFMMAVAIGMLVALWLVLTRTRIGLVIQAALTHPQQVEALGHNVPRVFMLVFGAGSALAGLAGVVGGNAFVTEPAMAGTVGAIVFVVIVVGGMGSLAGAFVAALLIGLLESFGKVSDLSGLRLLESLGWPLAPDAALYPVLKLTLSQVAPVLPYLLLVLILIVRPKGLLGTRED
jgi:branched-chain amino acid transport system permease protein